MVVNTCEVYGEEELTVKVLDIICDTLEVEENNHLQHRAQATGEGWEHRWLQRHTHRHAQRGTEPNVVSYTTTIGACTKEGMKNSIMALTLS